MRYIVTHLIVAVDLKLSKSYFVQLPVVTLLLGLYGTS